ncbi:MULTISPECIES: threonine/serine dehydratase [Anaerolinea]|uniref:threonine ammonia-lyase n=1 Tax=Anaerolinea TaxID=233189 RepID=UPI002637A49F|nr:pyridoxal-phosphate dependent enzyme [Anaerolinea thermophila]
MMFPKEWIEQAYLRLKNEVIQTPLTWDEQTALSFKWENHQITGSFKVRGALNRAFSLEEWELERGLVCASAGNHGQGVAYAAKRLGTSCIVFTYENASALKVEQMRAWGADVRFVSGNYADAEQAAIEYAQRHKMTWISPYNDPQVIAGQATIGVELIEQWAENIPESVVVPVGGGGLAAGIALAIQHLPNPPKVIGIQSEASPYFHALFHQGNKEKVVEWKSLADGLAGDLEESSITIPLVKSHLFDIRLVSEIEIAQAIRYAWENFQERIEGSAAVTLAAVMSGKVQEFPATLIISGGNIDSSLFEKIIHS